RGRVAGSSNRLSQPCESRFVDRSKSPPRMRLAVIGTGIAGLGAAYALDRDHTVELFERDRRIGGHTNTVEVRGGDRPLHVDTGFIVLNGVNYPRLIALFDELGVTTQESEMSFAVSCA